MMCVEDEARRPMGIFSINAVALYSEGRQAFYQLEKIMKRSAGTSSFSGEGATSSCGISTSGWACATTPKWMIMTSSTTAIQIPTFWLALLETLLESVPSCMRFQRLQQGSIPRYAF